MSSPLSLAASSTTGSTFSPTWMHLNPDPLYGLSGYQCPSYFFFSCLSSSSPKMLTRRRGSLLYRYEMMKFSATWISSCIAAFVECCKNLQGSSDQWGLRSAGGRETLRRKIFSCSLKGEERQGIEMNVTNQPTNVTLEQKKTVVSYMGIFVAIANNTLYGSKLSIFLLCQKSMGYYVKILFHEDVNFLP